MILNWLNTSLFGEGAGNEEYALKIVFHTCTDQAYTVLINRRDYVGGGGGEGITLHATDGQGKVRLFT